jgi:hypothetical protein
MTALRLEWAESKRQLGTRGTGRRANENGRVLGNLRRWKIVTAFLQGEEK